MVARPGCRDGGAAREGGGMNDRDPWTWRDYLAMTACYAIVAALAWLLVWPAAWS